MKIGFIHKVNTTPTCSGGSVHAFQVSQYLHQQGHKLSTFNNEKGNQFSARFPRSLLGLKALIKEVDVLYFRIDGKPGWEIVLALPELIQEKKPVLWEINATLEELKILPSAVRLRDKIGSALRLLSANRVNAALCVSAPLVKYAEDMGIHLAILTPNGSDPDLFYPELRDNNVFPGLENCFRVVWAGSTNYTWHDFKVMLECAAYLENIDKKIAFAVVGNRIDLGGVRVPNNVKFFLPVSYGEVPKYFAAADIGLCLYRSITWSQYGFFFSPLKLFDYAASGVPVIYTDFPELNRVAQTMGISVPEGDAQALANRILQLKQDHILYDSISKKARLSVLTYYNWARVGQQTEKMLEICTQYY